MDRTEIEKLKKKREEVNKKILNEQNVLYI